MKLRLVLSKLQWYSVGATNMAWGYRFFIHPRTFLQKAINDPLNNQLT